MVSVVVDNVSGRSFGWSVTISADLCELVTLERDPSKRTHAPTWEALLTLWTFPDRNSAAQGVRQEIRDFKVSRAGCRLHLHASSGQKLSLSQESQNVTRSDS